MRRLSLDTFVGDDDVTVEYYVEPADREVGIMNGYAVVEAVIKDGVDITDTIDEGILEDLEVRCIESYESDDHEWELPDPEFD